MVADTHNEVEVTRDEAVLEQATVGDVDALTLVRDNCKVKRKPECQVSAKSAVPMTVPRRVTLRPK
jgi:hypothetical protein